MCNQSAGLAEQIFIYILVKGYVHPESLFIKHFFLLSSRAEELKNLQNIF